MIPSRSGPATPNGPPNQVHWRPRVRDRCPAPISQRVGDGCSQLNKLLGWLRASVRSDPSLQQGEGGGVDWCQPGPREHGREVKHTLNELLISSSTRAHLPLPVRREVAKKGVRLHDGLPRASWLLSSSEASGTSASGAPGSAFPVVVRLAG